MKILYLDDNDDVRTNAESKLTALGHRVFVAGTLEAASEILREPENRIQLVITDHRMGGEDGFSFVLGLQQAFPQIKVCVLSQELTRSDINQLEGAGILHYRKPVLLEKIVREIRIPPPTKTDSGASTKADDAEGLLGKAGKSKRRGLFGLFSKR